MYKTLFNPDKTEYFDQLFEKIEGSDTIQNKIFENCNFKQCNFDNSNFISCKFVDCAFDHCTLNTITPTNTTFSGVVFRECKLMGVNWTKAKWQRMRLYCPMNFYDCDISYSSFFGLNLTEINIQKSKAHDVDFREADLSRANLASSDFYQSQFIHTTLITADFSEAINYSIDITLNLIKGATFTFPDVINLLKCLGIKINGLESEQN
jgi:fluoroquinolone resistance protein